MSHAYYNIRRAFLALALLLTVPVSQSFAQWVEAPAMPQVRNLSMQTYMDGKLYVFGGAPTFANDLSSAVIPTTASAKTAMVLNTSGGGSWTALSPMPTGRNGGFAHAANGKIYIVGGHYFASNAITFTPAVLEYDPVANTYAEKEAMPTPVTGAAYAAVDTKIYVFGGLSAGTNGLSFNNAIQIYDIAANSWEIPPYNAPYSSFYATATAIGQKILLTGGVTTDATAGIAYTKNTYLGTISPAGISWSKKADYPFAAGLMGSGTLNGKAYVAGGETALGTLSATYRFNESDNKWDSWYGIPIATANNHTMPSDGTSLYFISGKTNPKTYKLTAGTPAAIVVVPQTEYVLTASPGQALQALTLRVGNIGIIPLNGSINIPAEATSWLSTPNGTFSNVMPGTLSNLTINVGGPSVAAGDYKATVLVKTNDAAHSEVAVTIRLYVRAGLPMQPSKIVMEESSGSWCGPCGAYGVPLIRDLIEQYGEELLVIAYHDRGGSRSDPMYTDETEGIGRQLGVPFWPAASFQRWVFSGEKAPMVGTGSWPGAVTAVQTNQPNAPVSLTLKEYKYDQIGNKVTAKVELTTAQAMAWNSSLTLRLTAITIEDSIQFAQNGNAEDPFYHMHVARNFWPNTNGQEITIPATALHDDGAVLLPNQTFTVNMEFTPDNVVAPKRSHVVFLVSMNQGATLGPIFQGMEHDLTASMGTGGSITFDAGTTTKSVDANQEVTFESTVNNNTSGPIEIVALRTGVQYPEDNWTSRICVADDCAAADQNTKSTSIGPNSSKTFKLRVMTGSAGQGKVTLRFTDAAGFETTQEYTVNATSGPVGGVSIDAVAGNGLRLMQNSPNPASTVTHFGYTLPKSSNVSVDIFSMTGEKVLGLAKGVVEAGDRSFDLDVSSLPNGVYTVRLVANGTSVSRTITVAR